MSQGGAMRGAATRPGEGGADAMSVSQGAAVLPMERGGRLSGEPRLSGMTDERGSNN